MRAWLSAFYRHVLDHLLEVLVGAIGTATRLLHGIQAVYRGVQELGLGIALCDADAPRGLVSDLGGTGDAAGVAGCANGVVDRLR